MELKYIAIGLMALAMMGAALGLGQIFSAAANGIARNPNAEGKIKGTAILGAALTEALGIFGFVVAMLLIFVV